MHGPDDPTLFDADGLTMPAAASVADIARDFDPTRLTQARQLAGMSKRELSERIGVTAAAVGQYESGGRPRPEVLISIAQALDYPVAFFRAGRPYARLDQTSAHFRHLRETRAYQRSKAISFTEQTWELTYALERRVALPAVNLPGFSGGEINPGVSLPADPELAAKALRQHWGLGTGPIPHLVRTLEVHGIAVVLAPVDGDLHTVDAFSTSRLPRPIIVMSQERADDVYRHRFTAAHELGHLILHADALPGDSAHEREADKFAAEFLTPRNSIVNQLPPRANFAVLAELQQAWGVSVDSLIYRCREVGIFSDVTATRAYQRLNQLRSTGAFAAEPTVGFPGEQPTLLASAFELAADNGLTISALADELRWPIKRVRQLTGSADTRPTLNLLVGGGTGRGRPRPQRHLRAVEEG